MTISLESAQATAPKMNGANGSRNKIAENDKPFHDWYRFVLSFPPHLVRHYIEAFGLGDDDLLLDPFCGTGTTIVESKLCGVPSLGVEANRFAHFASSVKVNWEVDSKNILEVAKDIRDRSISSINKSGLSDDPEHNIVIPENLRNLPVDQEKMVLKNSMSPVPLHKAIILLEEIDRYKGTSYFEHLRLAFSKILVFKISNLRFGPEVGVGKLKQDVVVVEEWFNEIERMVKDLNQLNNRTYPEANVILSDSRDLSNVLEGRKISAVITSPPYPNEKDYSRTTRLESVMLGFVESKMDLREMKKTLLRSNTRGVYKEDRDDAFIKHIPEIEKIAKQIEDRRIDLGKTSGFEKMYARVTKLYFGGMAQHLKELSGFLKPGAQLGYVVGDQASYLRIMIRTGQLLSKIANTLGYETIRIDQFRTRFSTATKSNLNEEVVVLRWKG